jgi:hypothetical protein
MASDTEVRPLLFTMSFYYIRLGILYEDDVAPLLLRLS